MHTTKIGSYTFIHDGDPTGGMVHISDHTRNDIMHAGNQHQIPFDVMAKFVAEHIRFRRIAQLEQMSAEEILGLKRL